MAKAISRPSTIEFAKRIGDGCRQLKHPDWDILQVVTHDEPETFVKVHRISTGSQGRLIQVVVGFPDAVSLRAEESNRFLQTCARQIERAVNAVNASQDLKDSILRATSSALAASLR